MLFTRLADKQRKIMARIIELKIPDIGGNDGIELVKWNKQPGESFSAGDELCELVTDKAAFSLEAPKDGKLIEICVAEKGHPKIGELAARVEVE
jgi:pyruvate/2-oxoglutarate dehydrogenase complex dihydrolipoamide acyltransferase (E2) component